MTTLAVETLDATLAVSAPAPAQLIAATDPPLVLDVSPIEATLAVEVARAGVLTAPAERGADGPAGKDGRDGGNLTYTYGFPQPLSDWPIAHGLGRFPSVTIVDTSGAVIDTIVIYQDANNVLVSFTAPNAGTAYLN